MKFTVYFLLLSGMMYFVSCASTGSLKDQKGSYLESVKLNFDAGVSAMEKADYDKAVSYFQFVRNKYPFSKYAALSDLRIADVKFAQKKWLDAALSYELFIRYHPRHEEVTFALYRVGVSYFHAMPSNFFLLPDPATRDQSSTEQALAALDRFLLQFPDSEYVPDAKEKQGILFSHLAKSNMTIAAYYEKRKRLHAAVARYLSVEELYPSTEASMEALFLAAEILRKDLHDPDEAIKVYQRLIHHETASVYQEKAKAILEELDLTP